MLSALLCAFVASVSALVSVLVSGVGGAAVVPPSWADPQRNPCASLPGGWQLLQWPADGQCYRVFSRGPPCPPSMELTPGVGANGGPGCKCPPAWAQDAATQECHELFSRGPCAPGDYWAPKAGHGHCRSPAPCPDGHVFWARTGACLRRLTRGPCFRGELLVEAEPESGSALAACRCSPDGQLGKHFWPATATCHEHYTAGPCAEPGHLFLPGDATGAAGAFCGCSPNLAQFHAESGRCYQLETSGPCGVGQVLSASASAASGEGGATCRCKDGYLQWTGGGEAQGGCYRLWTRGPCPAGELLVNATQCAAAPCRPGRLFFPEVGVGACFKVGVRGPCPKGKVVQFESTVRPAVEGVSYRGACGCTRPGPSGCADISCENFSRPVLVNGTCYSLYTQGPCSPSQWLTPVRQGREGVIGPREQGVNARPSVDGNAKPGEARCECRPGYEPAPGSSGTECQAPAVRIAQFLNAQPV